MNLPVIFNNITRAAKAYAGTGVVLAKKHAPELMVASGIAGFVVTIIETVKATNKTNDILEIRDRDLHDTVIVDDGSGAMDSVYGERPLSEEEKRLIKRDARKALVKTWFPVVTTAGLSVILILKGYKIINGRYVATVAAYKTLEASYERYRENVVNEFGKDTDWRMANSISQERLEGIKQERLANDQIAEENKGKKKKDQKPYHRKYAEDCNYIFDENSINWKRWWTPRQFLDFIAQKMRECQDKFNIQGYLFVNDVLEIFGMPKTAEGQVLGWVKRRGKTTIISVGYDEMPDEEVRRILSIQNNSDLRFRLSMNPDGIVYNLIDQLDRDHYLIER